MIDLHTVQHVESRKSYTVSGHPAPGSGSSGSPGYSSRYSGGGQSRHHPYNTLLDPRSQPVEKREKPGEKSPRRGPREKKRNGKMVRLFRASPLAFLSRLRRDPPGAEELPAAYGNHRYGAPIRDDSRESPPPGREARNGKAQNRGPGDLDWGDQQTLPRKSGRGTPPPRGPFPVFIYSIFPIVGFLGLALYFFFLSSWSWSNEGAQLSPLEDTRFHYNMASYAGLVSEKDLAQAGEDIPLDLTETFAWQTYTVRNGDSVSKIAQNHGISMDAVIASNGMTNARRLQVGQEIRIPNMDGIPYTAKKGDSFSKISAAMGVPLPVILDANDIQSDMLTPGMMIFVPGARMKTEELKLALGDLFIYPIRGRLTSAFGWRSDPISGVQRYHAALDLAAPRGTPIKSAMDGKVATVGFNSTYGNFIIIVHGNGFQTMYAHMSKTSVSKGASVQQGTKIGEVGSTGYSTGNHLHFAIYKNGRAVNPLDYLNH